MVIRVYTVVQTPTLCYSSSITIVQTITTPKNKQIAASIRSEIVVQLVNLLVSMVTKFW